MSEETVRRVLHDLKVIAAVKEGQRIYRCQSGFLNLDNPSYMSSVYRFLSRDNRHKNLNDIINVINDAFAIAENACRRIESKQHTDTKENREHHVLQLYNFSLMLKMKSCVEECSIGLKNLRLTYKDDQSLSARIDVIDDLKNQSIRELTTSISLLNSKYKLSDRKDFDCTY